MWSDMVSDKYNLEYVILNGIEVHNKGGYRQVSQTETT
jgi:hypothetical protein